MWLLDFSYCDNKIGFANPVKISDKTVRSIGIVYGQIKSYSYNQSERYRPGT